MYTLKSPEHLKVEHNSSDCESRYFLNGKDRPLRVLRIIARLNVGGPAIQALSLANHFDNGVWNSLLVYGKVGNQEAEVPALLGMDTHNKVLLPQLGRDLHPIKDILSLISLIRIIRRYRPDVVHTHTAKAGTLGRIAAWICGVPVRVHTFHGHVFHGYFSPLKSKIFIMIEKLLLRITSKIIAISESQKEEIQGYIGGDDSRYDIVPLGFELEKFDHCKTNGDRGKLRKQLGVGPEKILVGIVGRITAVKNHRLLFEAARLICSVRRDILFVVVGDGEDRLLCESTVKEMGIEDHVRFIGWQSSMETIYADLDILALTSKNEGTPVCIIEAQSAGVPVVATRVGGVEDIVRHGVSAFICTPDNATEIADRITQLADNPEKRIVMGLNGKKLVANRFDEKRLKKDIGSLYLSLLPRN